MTEYMDDDIDARLAQLATHQPTGQYRYYAPLSEAADDYEHWATTPERRVYLGIPEFDEAMRGTAPGELTLVVGYAHSGKTVLATHMLLQNRDKSIVYFTPDETRTLVIVKLTCAIHHVSARTIESGLMDGNKEVKNMLRETADQFPMLGVFDEGLTVVQMEKAMDETEKATGRAPQALLFDFGRLLRHEGDIMSKLEALKNFGSNKHIPMFVIHQTSRTAGRDGEAIDMDSGEFGGETLATHMIGVRKKERYYKMLLVEIDKKMANPALSNAVLDELHRQRYEITLELERHKHTVTINLIKNKRPPCDLVDETDFEIDRNTGCLRELQQAYSEVLDLAPLASGRSLLGGD